MYVILHTQSTSQNHDEIDVYNFKCLMLLFINKALRDVNMYIQFQQHMCLYLRPIQDPQTLANYGNNPFCNVMWSGYVQ